jgi:hypothetical protein
MKLKTLITAIICGFAMMAKANTLNLNDTIAAIYGSGNPNHGWVSSTAPDNSVLALRANNRNNGVVPNNGDSSYSFPIGTDPANPARAIWNFAFSVEEPGGLTSKPNDYILSLVGPGGVNYSFDVRLIPDNAYLTAGGISPAMAFSSMGFGPMSSLGGTVFTGTFGDYGPLSIMMQNSENIVFFGGNPNLPGDYKISLQSIGPSGVENSVGITVHVGSVNVPDSAGTFAMSAMAFLPILLSTIRRKK